MDGSSGQVVMDDRTSVIHVLVPKKFPRPWGFLVGELHYIKEPNGDAVNDITTIVLLGVHERIGDIKQTDGRAQVVGYLSDGSNGATDSVAEILEWKKSAWLELGCNQGHLLLHELWLSNKQYECESVIMIEYDSQDVLGAEILQAKYGGLQHSHFLTPLLTVLQRKWNCTEKQMYNLVSFRDKQWNPRTLIWSGFMSIALALNWVLTLAGKKFPSLLQRIIVYSALGDQITCRLKQIHWCTLQVKEQQRLDWRSKNFLISFSLDIAVGILLLYWLNRVVCTQDLLQYIIGVTEVIVDRLQFLIRWLMGYPAGLKLNAPLNDTLGGYFLYHIYLWKTYIELLHPVLYVMLELVLALGWGGLTFQLAVLGDLVSLATFHIYCFYVYAARLYNIQVRAMSSFWRLFLGKKWNPLRMRVDSCSYSIDQLFVGALAFTILIFLLPTTMVYYLVFTCLRIGVLALEGLFNRMRLLGTLFPWWALLLWILCSPKVGGNVYVNTCGSREAQPLRVFARVIPVSLRETIVGSVPVKRPKWSQIDCTTLLVSFLTGRLIYPL